MSSASPPPAPHAATWRLQPCCAQGGGGTNHTRSPPRLSPLPAVCMAPAAFNSFGEGCADLVAALARGDKLQGQLGLWPRFSLINHSCAPNAVHLTLGDRLCVRAALHVPAGAELSINYLGRWAAGAWRRQALTSPGARA